MYFIIFFILNVFSVSLNEFQNLSKQYKWTIVGRDSCPFCRKAEELLKTRTPCNYLKIDSTKSPEVTQYLRQTYNHKTVPSIFMCGQFIGGYGELSRILNGGVIQ